MIEISGIKKSHHAVTEGGTEILILIFQAGIYKEMYTGKYNTQRVVTILSSS